MIPAAIHPDIQLAEFVAQYRANPLDYVRVAFPWGEPGPLLHHAGPCPCQVRVFTVLGEEIRKRAFNGRDPVRPIRIAVASGHGIGKSAFFGMLDNFLRSTRPHCRGTVTANTFQQLSTKTWAAIQEWNRRSITSHWFEITSDRAYQVDEKESWFSSAQSCSEDNSEAFAGQHAADSTSYYINDECSGISDKIFEVEEGGLTDGEPMQFAFGNLTRPLGKFARIMAGHEQGWIRIRIDSRECPLTNKEQIAEWVEEFGEDSDFVRVRVRGLAPRAATAQFIDEDLVNQAVKRVVTPLPDEPLVAGVDFAWGGEDKNTVRFRRGFDARSIAPSVVAGELTRTPDLMVNKLAEVLSREWNGRKVAMLFMDSAGIAGPVAMRLRELGFKNLVDVNFMAHAPNVKYRNMRSYIWGEMKEWLTRGAIDKSVTLHEDLTAPEVLKHVPLLLEPKDAIIKRIGHSTDDGDALALTFAFPVRAAVDRRNMAASMAMSRYSRSAGQLTGWS